MRATLVAWLLSSTFGALLAVHCSLVWALVWRLTPRLPPARALAALLVPFAPWVPLWAWRAGLRRRVAWWLALLFAHAVLLVLAYAVPWGAP